MTGDPEYLLKYLAQHRFLLDKRGAHGPRHWLRVRDRGVELCRSTGADPKLVTLFAYLHDAFRYYENDDPEHGLRAAKSIMHLRHNDMIKISYADSEVLYRACRLHSDGITVDDDITVMTCWDADRLDLGRVGITPDPKYLCTDAAKKMLRRELRGIIHPRLSSWHSEQT